MLSKKGVEFEELAEFERAQATGTELKKPRMTREPKMELKKMESKEDLGETRETLTLWNLRRKLKMFFEA